MLRQAAWRLGPIRSRPFAARSFSSSRDKGNQSFESGAGLAVGWWRRCIGRLSKLGEYQDERVFIDSLGTLEQCWLFIQLQLPQKTNVDLLEFVEGARIATEANLCTMNRVEFAEFLADKESSSSDVAESLQQFMTPTYYHEMALQVKKNYLQRKFYVECEAMHVERAQLAQVVYRRLTQKEYDDLVAFNKPADGMLPDATIEHLRLHVDVVTVEDLKLVFLEGKTRHVQQQNIYRVIFESRVTEPEQVDWRIHNMHIIEQNASEHFVETTEKNSEYKKSE